MMQQENDNLNVFISHNRKQKPWVRQVVAQWKQLNLKVFFDEESITPVENFTECIEKGLKRCRYIVLVLTPEAVASNWVAMETTIAMVEYLKAQGKRIIPVLLEPVEPERIRPTISVLQWVDLTNPETQRDQYHSLLRSLGITHSPLPDPPVLPLSRSFHLTKRGKALAIGSHWDDVLLGCLGILLKLKAMYEYKVKVAILCTNYHNKYYGVEQHNLEERVKIIYEKIKERHKFEYKFMTPSTHRYLLDRQFRDKSGTLHEWIKELAEKREDYNLILTPPIDDRHDDHAFTGQLVFSYFRRTYQTVL